MRPLLRPLAASALFAFAVAAVATVVALASSHRSGHLLHHTWGAHLDCLCPGGGGDGGVAVAAAAAAAAAAERMLDVGSGAAVAHHGGVVAAAAAAA